MIRFSLVFLVLSVFTITNVVAQKTIVRGTVKDAETGESLPFVNLVFKDSKIGTSTDINGSFYLETYYPSDSLICSFVGYKRQIKAVKKDVSQTIEFNLGAGSVSLGEIEVVGTKKDINPAEALLDRVINNKFINNREKLDAFQYEVYNKIEFDVNNIHEEFGENKLMQPFEFIFENIDTTENKPFLPFFITETMSDFYFKKNPKYHKEIIKAAKVSGLENESISQFLGDMYQNVNIYDNYLYIFQQGFVSPISNFGKFTYNYYIVDSAFIDNYWCYKLDFSPKRKAEPTFIGHMWISDTTYAVKRIEAGISEGTNINFINEFKVIQEFSEVEKEVWMLTKDQLIVDFQLSAKTLGFYGRKTATYRDFDINKPKQASFYEIADDIIVEDSAGLRGDEYWNRNRHQELTASENIIYHMVDSLKEIPRFNTYIDIITLLVSGYYVAGPVEIGPYFTFYSFNPIEGNRFRFGCRTSNSFSKMIMPEAYLAYGTRDRKFKYGGGVKFFITKKPRQMVKLYYRNDLEQLGQGINAWRTDNIVASVFRRNPAVQLNGFEEYKVQFEREWFQGFSNEISFTRRNLWSVSDSLKFLTLASDGNPVELPGVAFSEISLLTRFAYKEKFVAGEFERVSLGTKYPTLQLKYSLGIKDFLGGEYNYHRLVLNVRDKIWFAPLGFSNVIFEAGKIWGNAPFPVLELHNGNETLAYDPTAFNLMNFYEFVSDEYTSLAVTHHFNGLFFNRIPLFRKLKFRELASFKGVVGNLDPANRNVLLFPSGLGTLSRPYAEAGFGVENIAKVLRIDAWWRLTYLDNPDIAKFGIRALLQVRF